MKVPVIIDGKMVHVDRGTPLIKAARKLGIVIPALCHHEALKPYGSCRLCMVEIVQNKRRKMVTSCNHPADSGMEVFTDTDKVRGIRKMVLEMLLARCPESDFVRDLGSRMGVESTRFKNTDKEECILCGLCVRFCEEVVGAGAIGISSRGIESEVSTPFMASSEDCIACGSCTYICPAGCIDMVPDEDNPDGMTLVLGGLSLTPCPEGYECASCDVDSSFVSEMKKAIQGFRNRGSS
jgi:NADH dehydrogenase/NADH:ubiquinone oxidoreductase subunit G